MMRAVPVLAAVGTFAATTTILGGLPGVVPPVVAVLIVALIPVLIATPSWAKYAPLAVLFVAFTPSAPTYATALAAIAFLPLVLPYARVSAPVASAIAASVIVYSAAPLSAVAAVLAAVLSSAAWYMSSQRSTPAAAMGFVVSAIALSVLPLIAFTEGNVAAGALVVAGAIAMMAASLWMLRRAGPLPRTIAAMAAIVVAASPVAFVHSTTATTYEGPAATQAMASCVELGNDTIKAVECYSLAFLDVYRSSNLTETLDLLKTIYAQSGSLSTHFSENCHEVLHFVGKAVALDYADDLESAIRLGTDMCSAGWGHGIWEMKYGSLTTPELLEQVPTICRGKDGLNRSEEGSAGIGCRHILGHTLASRYRGQVEDIAPACLLRDPAIDPNSEWSQDEIIARNNCLAGLFMENNLDLNRFRGENIDSANPFATCEGPKVVVDEILMWGCYNEVGAMVVPYNDYNMAESLIACQEQQVKFTIPDWIIDSCYDSISRAIAPALDYDIRSMAQACSEVPAGELYAHCITGIASTVTFSSNIVEEGMSLCTDNLTDPEHLEMCTNAVLDVADILAVSRTEGDNDLPAPSVEDDDVMQTPGV